MRPPSSSPAPAAVIIGSGRGALAAVRALGRRGITVHVAGPRRGPASASRFARSYMATPDPLQEEAAFADTLRELARRFETRPVLVPSDDVTVEAVTAHWDHLASRFRLIGPPPAVARDILDKARQYERIAAAGIEVPRTWVPESSGDAERIAAEARFPVIVKPRHSQRFFMARGFKAARADDPATLARLLHDFAVPALVQELVGGGCEQGYEFTSFVNDAGRIACSLVLRKRDVHPSPFGNTTVVETVHRPEVEELGGRVLGALGYRGISQSEFKRDPVTRRFLFIEINPRIVNNTGIEVMAGADTVYAAFAQAAALPPPEAVRTATRVVWHCPELRFFHAGTVALPRPSTDALPGPTRQVTDLFQPGDPLPLLRKGYDALLPRLRQIHTQWIAGSSAHLGLPPETPGTAVPANTPRNSAGLGPET